MYKSVLSFVLINTYDYNLLVFNRVLYINYIALAIDPFLGRIAIDPGNFDPFLGFASITSFIDDLGMLRPAAVRGLRDNSAGYRNQ